MYVICTILSLHIFMQQQFTVRVQARKLYKHAAPQIAPVLSVSCTLCSGVLTLLPPLCTTAEYLTSLNFQHLLTHSGEWLILAKARALEFSTNRCTTINVFARAHVFIGWFSARSHQPTVLH